MSRIRSNPSTTRAPLRGSSQWDSPCDLENCPRGRQRSISHASPQDADEEPDRTGVAAERSSSTKRSASLNSTENELEVQSIYHSVDEEPGSSASAAESSLLHVSPHPEIDDQRNPDIRPIENEISSSVSSRHWSRFVNQLTVRSRPKNPRPTSDVGPSKTDKKGKGRAYD
ncbi:hypothetical protein BU15DRAFT_83410 [Melanogaster broomeanus]|nr:hypothetical protein BU15DRAFT_83410 [Melanogaster broomeanus]